MGKIDKEKLLKDCKCLTDGYNFTYCMNQCKKYRGGENFQECITKVIKNFPEEPEIDFDAIYKEYTGSVQFDSTQSAWGFRDFLKSKNLTAPKPVEIPVKCPSCGCPSFKIDESMMCSACGAVFEPTRKLEISMKKTWTLKKHVEEIFHDFGNTPYPLTSDPPENLKKYYDQHEEPDYSQIPKGSIVVVSSKDDKIKSAEIVDHFDSNYIYCNGGVSYELKYVKIRIVELAKE